MVAAGEGDDRVVPPAPAQEEEEEEEEAQASLALLFLVMDVHVLFSDKFQQFLDRMVDVPLVQFLGKVVVVSVLRNDRDMVRQCRKPCLALCSLLWLAGPECLAFWPVWTRRTGMRFFLARLVLLVTVPPRAVFFMAVLDKKDIYAFFSWQGWYFL